MAALEEIHERLENAELMGKQVSLAGFDIIVPLISYDLTVGSEIIRSEVVDAISGHGDQLHQDTADDDEEDQNFKSPPLKGIFYGFHPVVTLDVSGGNEHDGDTRDSDLLDDETEDDVDELADSKYRVAFHYRVGVQERMFLGTVVGSLYALGNITSTHLTFAEDEQEQDAAVALNALTDASYNETAALAAATINTLLTPTDDETVFEPYRLHEIAIALRNLESYQGVDTQFRAAAINLVTARLGAYPKAQFIIEAANGFLRTNNQVLFSDEVFRTTFPILGLEFAPQFAIDDDGDIIHTGEEVLSVVIQATTDGENITCCYIPFPNLEFFMPYEPENDDSSY